MTPAPALGALIPVVIALVVISTVIYLLSAQVALFLNDIPSVKKHLAGRYLTVQHRIETSFNTNVTL